MLGPVDVRHGDGPVPLGGLRSAAIVASLLLGSGRVVPVEQLVAAVWGDRPPATAHVQAQNRISRLRRAFGADAGVIVTTGSGYRLHLAGHDADLHRFEALVAGAESDLAAGRCYAAADALGTALALWRGPALDGLGTPPLAVAAQRLEERRLYATERHVALGLAAGRHTELLPELHELVERHPFHEQFRGHLMLALFRAGRQADALETFRRTRVSFAEQLGLEPGELLNRLHIALLRGDGELAAAAILPAAPERIRTGSPPRQLPARVSRFTGRTAQLRHLSELLAGAGTSDLPIVVVAGAAGVGKTALAVHWAHGVADRFLDGQLYIDLRGYNPDRPVEAADALAGFLIALGVSIPDIPSDVDQRAARFRSETAGRSLLLLLDNAATAEQIRPLLPGSGRCAVVVTSRDTLPGLVARDGAHRLALDVLPEPDAVTLLCRLIGPRADADPAAIAALSRACVRLPLALREAAELASAHPDVPLGRLAGELADRQRRLGLLDAGGARRAAVAGPFSRSARHLPPHAARFLALLGLHPGPQADPYAA